MDLIQDPEPLRLALPSDEFDTVVAAFAALVRYQLTSVIRDGQPAAGAVEQCGKEAA